MLKFAVEKDAASNLFVSTLEIVQLAGQARVSEYPQRSGKKVLKTMNRSKRRNAHGVCVSLVIT